MAAANHLQGQTSPYLLQHLHNPVDWHPWGEPALARARAERKPILLSIGYAACHWCHVMERESFEDPGLADYLNRHFVPIKVDREERPDLDEIYMHAVQLMTGSGGWPLNVFLTPDLRPFYGGTYFPPTGRWGRPGFREVLEHVHELWSSRTDDVERAASQMAEHLRQLGARSGTPEPGIPGAAERLRAAAELTSRFDGRWGGFGGAPKFPPDSQLALLLSEHLRGGETVPWHVVRTTLERMATGGMYDQIGGGFSRYSVDERWLIPHFEKMLYTQALLVPLYVDAWRLSGAPLFRRVVEQTLDFVRRELTDPAGGFWSSLDADSEGEEGRFYAWTPAEVDAALGAADGAFFRDVYGIDEAGNFEGRSVAALHGGSLAERAKREGLDEARLDARLRPLREKLLAVRATRVRPATDDKVLTSWNGLMLGACARAYQVCGRGVDLGSARRAADFLLEHALHDGRLRASWRAGQGQLNGYLDDYAFLGRGLVELYEACFEPRYLRAAERLARTILERFEDREHGGFLFTSDDHEVLLVRSRSLYDGALPSGGAVATELLLRLAVHLDEPPLRTAAERALAAVRAPLSQAPSAFSSWLVAAERADGPALEVAVVGDPAAPRTRELLAVVHRRPRPRLVLAGASPEGVPDDLPLLAGKGDLGGAPAAWVCRNYACRQPTSDPSELERLLGAL